MQILYFGERILAINMYQQDTNRLNMKTVFVVAYFLIVAAPPTVRQEFSLHFESCISSCSNDVGIGVWKRGDCGICRSQVEWCKGMDGVVTVQCS